MWPSPSDPATIPTTIKRRAMGMPVRCEARLKITLTPSRSPQVVRRSAVASGSWGMRRGYSGAALLATMRLGPVVDDHSLKWKHDARPAGQIAFDDDGQSAASRALEEFVEGDGTGVGHQLSLDAEV